MLMVYGIAQCDTVKAARTWLKEHGIAHDFLDLRKDHIAAATIAGWLERLGNDTLINKQSATWRTLDRSQREQIEAGNPLPVILANPTLLRRPILVGADLLHAGFNRDDYAQLFKIA
jgi:arsenate reductase (glutaredoxin)